MAGGTGGAASGVVLAIVLVILDQQFGFVQLSDFQSSITILLVSMVVFGIIFGLLGRALKGRAIRKARGIQEWKAPAEPSATASSESVSPDAGTEPTAPKT